MLYHGPRAASPTIARLTAPTLTFARRQAHVHTQTASPCLHVYSPALDRVAPPRSATRWACWVPLSNIYSARSIKLVPGTYLSHYTLKSTSDIRIVTCVRQRCCTTVSLSEVTPEAQASRVCWLCVAITARTAFWNRTLWIADAEERGAMPVFVAVGRTGVVARNGAPKARAG